MKTEQQNKNSFNKGDKVWADDIRDVYMYPATIVEIINSVKEPYYLGTKIK